MLTFDPTAAPVVLMGNESALSPDRINLDWIKHRFLHPAEWQAESTDEHLLSKASGELKDAAVLILLVPRATGIHLVFTQRTSHLAHHPGQISFPGGRTESFDLDAIQTALRESREEVGLDESKVAVFGTLPVYHTVTGYRVTPVVGAATAEPIWQVDHNEVAEVFEVPLAFLMDGQSHQIRQINASSFPKGRRFYAMQYHDYFIWGATAGMLRNLFHFLRA